MKRAISTLGKRIFRVSGIRIVRFKCRIENHGITLRLLRLRDLSILHHLLGPEVFLVTGGVGSRSFSSLFSFGRWMVSIFQVLYVIEATQNGVPRTIGFVGLSSVRMGQSLWLSAALFDPRDRGQGYGREALEPLLNFLQKKGIVKTVYAQVLRGNLRSLHLLEHLGFKVCWERTDSLLLEKNMVGDH